MIFFRYRYFLFFCFIFFFFNPFPVILYFFELFWELFLKILYVYTILFNTWASPFFFNYYNYELIMPKFKLSFLSFFYGRDFFEDVFFYYRAVLDKYSLFVSPFSSIKQIISAWQDIPWVKGSGWKYWFNFRYDPFWEFFFPIFESERFNSIWILKIFTIIFASCYYYFFVYPILFFFYIIGYVPIHLIFIKHYIFYHLIFGIDFYFFLYPILLTIFFYYSLGFDSIFILLFKFFNPFELLLKAALSFFEIFSFKIS